MHLDLPKLPVTEVLPELLHQLESNTRVVLEAPPGAGKTTLVPLALLQANWRKGGKILVLEPRRIATRAAAQRMSDLLHEPIGQTVGYWIRMEHVLSAKTEIEVVTEGILTRLLQDDPALEGIAAVIFDEFHERSLQADLGLALALDAQAVLRPDLRIIVMSATLDADLIGNWLKAPVVKSEGRQYPIETHYLSNTEVATIGSRPLDRILNFVPKAIRKAIDQHDRGDILVFLPGMNEIRKVTEKLDKLLPSNVEVHTLHGDLILSKQLAAIQPSPASRRKVVLATSIAETSLTIEGVTIVIDGGYARVPEFIPRTGLTTLVTIPVSKAAANQRRGRAGRLAPGICYRMWSNSEQLRLPERQTPEICEADLTGLVLELAIWGVNDIHSLSWLDTPPSAAVSLAKDLLVRLEALDQQGKPTAHGKLLAPLGLPPRLGHLVVKGHHLGYGATACALAALLSEKEILKPIQSGPGLEQTDLQLRLEILEGKRPYLPNHTIDENALRRAREQATNLRQRIRASDKQIYPDVTGILVALAYPDRMAQLESSGRVRLVTGHKVSLPTELFGEAEFYGIAHLDLSKIARALLVAPISKSEILNHFSSQLKDEDEYIWDEMHKRVDTRRSVRLGALLLQKQKIPNPNTQLIANTLLEAVKQRGIENLPWSDAALRTRQRLAYLHQFDPLTWPDVSENALIETIEDWLGPHLYGLKSMDQVNKLDLQEILLSDLAWEKRQVMDRVAPTHLDVPSGSKIQLDYSNPSTPVLAVRLQEVFGMLETPCIGNGKTPLLMHLLSPASRPVQVTRDLKSFWATGYFDVRKDLRGRYPKHHWPENPLDAIPSRGIKRKPSK